VCQRLLGDAMFHRALLELDGRIAADARAEGCLECAGPMHQANFGRKPRGGPTEEIEGFATRYSFCCGDCRRRRTPASVRFLGRRVYLGVAVSLASILLQGASPRRRRRVQAALGASARALKRWVRWWRTTFAASRFWQRVSGTVVPAIAADDLPRGLWQRVAGAGFLERLVSWLKLLVPITTGTGLAGAR
jgi:hypothetical protein